MQPLPTTPAVDAERPPDWAERGGGSTASALVNSTAARLIGVYLLLFALLSVTAHNFLTVDNS
jgi:hypothetical protein